MGFGIISLLIPKIYTIFHTEIRPFIRFSVLGPKKKMHSENSNFSEGEDLKNPPVPSLLFEFLVQNELCKYLMTEKRWIILRDVLEGTCRRKTLSKNLCILFVCSGFAVAQSIHKILYIKYNIISNLFS